MIEELCEVVGNGIDWGDSIAISSTNVDFPRADVIEINTDG